MLRFNIFIRKNRDNRAFLRLYNNCTQEATAFSLGISIAADELAAILSDAPVPPALAGRKRFIKDILYKVESYVFRMIEDGRNREPISTTKDAIHQILFDRPATIFTRKKKGSFFEYYMKHIESLMAPKTRTVYQYTAKVIKKYCPEAEALKFEDITYSWLKDLEIYMTKGGMSQNTRRIHFANIKSTMKEAYRRDLTDNDPFRKFTFQSAKTAKRSLSVDKLRMFISYPVESFAVIYRDMFTLIFTLLGINTIDLYNLKEITKDGRVEYKRSKTGTLFSIKVEPEAMAIIEKYKGKKNLLCLADRWEHHDFFRAQMNKALQRIGIAQGKGQKDLDEKEAVFPGLTSYWARHTWATIATSIGIDNKVISKALGHADSSVTDIYIDFDMEQVEKANRKVLDWVFYGKRDN